METGDIIIVLDERDHDRFGRKGSDLIYKMVCAFVMCSDIIIVRGHGNEGSLLHVVGTSRSTSTLDLVEEVSIGLAPHFYGYLFGLPRCTFSSQYHEGQAV